MSMASFIETSSQKTFYWLRMIIVKYPFYFFHYFKMSFICSLYIADFGVAHIFTNLYRTNKDTEVTDTSSTTPETTPPLLGQLKKSASPVLERQDSIEQEVDSNDINRLSSYDSYSEHYQLYRNLSRQKSYHENSSSDNIFLNSQKKTGGTNEYDNDMPLLRITQSLSEVTKTMDGDLTNTPGTKYYMPPEVCCGEKYNTFAADISFSNSFFFISFLYSFTFGPLEWRSTWWFLELCLFGLIILVISMMN